MTNRNLSLIKELDIKIERIKHTLAYNPKMDHEKKNKLADEIVSLSHEKVKTHLRLKLKIQIAEQLEQNVEHTLKNLNQHIGKMIKKIEREHQKPRETTGFTNNKSSR